jgi:hypothetical protein
MATVLAMAQSRVSGQFNISFFAAWLKSTLITFPLAAILGLSGAFSVIYFRIMVLATAACMRGVFPGE